MSPSPKKDKHDVVKKGGNDLYILAQMTNHSKRYSFFYENNNFIVQYFFVIVNEDTN